MAKVCRTPGCPTLIHRDAYRGMCPPCQRNYDKARGTKAERGYGADHQRARADLVRQMNAGVTIRCWRCDAVLTPTTLHLDHTTDRTNYRGPACDACNMHLAGVARHSSR